MRNILEQELQKLEKELISINFELSELCGDPDPDDYMKMCLVNLDERKRQIKSRIKVINNSLSILDSSFSLL